MTKRRSVRQELRIGDMPDDELVVLLTSVCPRSAQFRSSEVEYRTDSDETVLTLQYSKGQLTDGFTGPAWNESIAERLRSAIQAELRDPPIIKVWLCQMFASRAVNGAWRYADSFQIVPAPQRARRPDTILGDHPFLLDVTFVFSDNWQIRQGRDDEGPSSGFIEFMRQYAPGKPSRTVLDGIYGARSDVTHGGRLLNQDISPTSWSLNQKSAQDEQTTDEAQLLSRGAILNWLWNHDQARAEPLFVEGVERGNPEPRGTKSKVRVITTFNAE